MGNYYLCGETFREEKEMEKVNRRIDCQPTAIHLKKCEWIQNNIIEIEMLYPKTKRK